MRRSLVVPGIIAAIVFGYCEASQAIITGQYLFEEGSGTTALNTATNPLGDARNGTLKHVEGETPVDVIGGPTYVPGLYNGSNYALLFNAGNRDRVDLPQNMDFIRNASGATIVAWVRIDGSNPFLHPDADPPSGSVFPTIAQVNNATTVNPDGIGARAAITASTHFGFRAVGSQANEGRTSVDETFCQPSGAICGTEGRVYFVAGVFDYVNRRTAIWIDGVEQNFNPSPLWPTGGNSADASNLFASIGAGPVATAPGTNAWHGAIDGVRFFNTALDFTAIQAIYNAELKLPVPGDYNGNGIVDTADYVLWRDGSPAADGTGPGGTPDGVVDNLDYNFWKARFGKTSGSGSAAPIPAPEPATCVLALVLGALTWVGRRQQR